MYVNGEYCTSYKKAMDKIEEITGVIITTEYQIRDMIDGKKKVYGIEVSFNPPEDCGFTGRKIQGALLHYPKGESPLERGLYGGWK